MKDRPGQTMLTGDRFSLPINVLLPVLTVNGNQPLPTPGPSKQLLIVQIGMHDSSGLHAVNF